jgi:D-galactonate transporter
MINVKHAALPTVIASTVETKAYEKISWRLLPFIVICYLIAYLDRVNVGFAKLQMLSDLKFTDAIYGLGAGIFFAGYFICEVPSNLALAKFGARKWIARIMISWGIIAALTAFVRTPVQFYTVRFFLGMAEAGFSPGIMLYLTYWFPARKRGFALGIYYIAIPLSGVIGGPLSGWIMDVFKNSAVMSGWQWLFLLEAIPSILIGLVVLFVLIDKPEQAKWLTAEEKQFVVSAIQRESHGKTEHSSVLDFLKDRRLWLLCLVYFCQIMGLYAVSFWVPSIIKASGIQDVMSIGLLSAIPYSAAIAAIVVTGITADRTRARRMHFSLAMVLGAIGLSASVFVRINPALAIIFLSLGSAATLSGVSLFWGIPTAFLAGVSAAAGIASINSVGNLAGFLSPYMVGWLNDATHRNEAGMYAVSAFMIIGALLVRAIPGHLADR